MTSSFAGNAMLGIDGLCSCNGPFSEFHTIFVIVNIVIIWRQQCVEHVIADNSLPHTLLEHKARTFL